MRQGGFTLLETLVTLAIASAIATTGLMMLAQLTRAEQTLGDARLATTAHMVPREWVQTLLSGALPDHPDGKTRFEGTANSLTALSTALIGSRGGMGGFRLELNFEAHSGTTELRYTSPPDGTPVVLLTFPGPDAHFTYFDEKGHPSDRWPPAMSDAPQLPRSIALGGTDTESLPIVASPSAAPTPLLRRSDLLKL